MDGQMEDDRQIWHISCSKEVFKGPQSAESWRSCKQVVVVVIKISFVTGPLLSTGILKGSDEAGSNEQFEVCGIVGFTCTGALLYM